MLKHRSLTSILVILNLLILMTGTACSDQRILERTGFIQSTSYDLLPNGKIVYGISVPIANPDIDTTSLRVFLKTEAASGKSARIELARHTNLLLVSGQLRISLFGQNLAKKGLFHYMDSLMRDPTIAEQVKIIIVEGDANHLLERNFKEYPRTGKYVDNLIKKESKGQTTPKTTIYSFTRDYYDDGIDPIAPIVKEEADSITVNGIALFNDDRFVGKVEAENALIFAFLYGNFKEGELSVELLNEPKKNTNIMLSSINSSRKLNVKHEPDGQITVNINSNVYASVLEYNGERKISNKADKVHLEQEISEIVTKRAEKIIKKLQQKNADSLGIGTHVRNGMSNSAWKKLNWKEKYPDITINCNVKFIIKEQGFLK